MDESKAHESKESKSEEARETNTEFEIRHEYHTPFEGPQKAYEGKFIDVELNGKRYSNASKKNYYKGMI